MQNTVSNRPVRQILRVGLALLDRPLFGGQFQGLRWIQACARPETRKLEERLPSGQVLAIEQRGEAGRRRIVWTLRRSPPTGTRETRDEHCAADDESSHMGSFQCFRDRVPGYSR